VWEGVAAADLEARPAVGERHVDGVVEAELDLAGVEEREERAIFTAPTSLTTFAMPLAIV
jgi:hypothetical protein